MATNWNRVYWRLAAKNALGLSKPPRWTIGKCKKRIKDHEGKKAELAERPACVSG